MHLYTDVKELNNLRNNESGVSITDSDAMRKTFESVSSDIWYKLSESNQSDFDDSIQSWIQELKADVYQNEHLSHKNALRQAFALQIAFNHSVKYMKASGFHYYQWIFLAPSHFLCNQTTLQYLEPNKILIPQWSSNEIFTNDMVAFAGYTGAAYYSRKVKFYEKCLKKLQGLAHFEYVTHDSFIVFRSPGLASASVATASAGQGPAGAEAKKKNRYHGLAGAGLGPRKTLDSFRKQLNICVSVSTIICFLLLQLNKILPLNILEVARLQERMHHL